MTFADPDNLVWIKNEVWGKQGYQMRISAPWWDKDFKVIYVIVIAEYPGQLKWAWIITLLNNIWNITIQGEETPWLSPYGISLKASMLSCINTSAIWNNAYLNTWRGKTKHDCEDLALLTDENAHLLHTKCHAPHLNDLTWPLLCHREAPLHCQLCCQATCLMDISEDLPNLHWVVGSYACQPTDHCQHSSSVQPSTIFCTDPSTVISRMPSHSFLQIRWVSICNVYLG